MRGVLCERGCVGIGRFCRLIERVCTIRSRCTKQHTHSPYDVNVYGGEKCSNSLAARKSTVLGMAAHSSCVVIVIVLFVYACTRQ